MRKPIVRFKSWKRAKREKSEGKYSKKELEQARVFLTRFVAEHTLAKIKRRFEAEKQFLQSLENQFDLLNRLAEQALLEPTDTNMGKIVLRSSKIIGTANEFLNFRSEIKQYWLNRQIVEGNSEETYHQLQMHTQAIEKLQDIKNKVNATLNEIKFE